MKIKLNRISIICLALIFILSNSCCKKKSEILTQEQLDQQNREIKAQLLTKTEEFALSMDWAEFQLFIGGVVIQQFKRYFVPVANVEETIIKFLDVIFDKAEIKAKKKHIYRRFGYTILPDKIYKNAKVVFVKNKINNVTKKEVLVKEIKTEWVYKKNEWFIINLDL